MYVNIKGEQDSGSSVWRRIQESTTIDISNSGSGGGVNSSSRIATTERIGRFFLVLLLLYYYYLAKLAAAAPEIPDASTCIYTHYSAQNQNCIA